MNKIIFSLSFMCAFNLHGMEPQQQRQKVPVGFDSAHYSDFLYLYFQGKPTPQARATYLNFCMRDELWSLFLEFLEDGGSRVVDMAEKPANDSVALFQLARSKLETLATQLDETRKTIDRLEGEYKVIIEKDQNNQGSKKKRKGTKG